MFAFFFLHYFALFPCWFLRRFVLILIFGYPFLLFIVYLCLKLYFCACDFIFMYLFFKYFSCSLVVDYACFVRGLFESALFAFVFALGIQNIKFCHDGVMVIFVWHSLCFKSRQYTDIQKHTRLVSSLPTIATLNTTDKPNMCCDHSHSGSGMTSLSNYRRDWSWVQLYPLGSVS